MRRPVSHFIVLVCTALLAVTAAPRAWSDEAPGISPDVLVLVHPQDAPGDEFRQVVADAIRIELESLGLSVALSPGSAGSGGGPAEQARAGSAPVAIDCSYSIFGDEISVSMGWYEARDGSRAAKAEKSGRIGLRLDTIVLEALDSILTTLQDRVRELAAARKITSAAVSTAGQQAEPAAQGGTVSQSPGKKSSTQLLLVGGFAPFIATGAASYYFTLGYLPSVLASLVFDTAAGRVGVGIYAGMNYFAAQGSADSSNNFLIPIGADVRYELELSRFLFSLHFTGGPATLVVLTASGNTFVNVIPFLKSGIGAEFLIKPWLGISFTVDYEIYFEVPYLFMGITPSLGMTFRL
jgi:hypothetical protein